MSDSNIKIEVHLIQNFAPSNLNRDDTGQPKSAVFGGFRRARISSQCSKRSVRLFWRERQTVPLGYRTKRLQELIVKELKKDESFKSVVPNEEDISRGVRLFTDAYYAESDKKNPDKTNVLVFIGPEEVEVCAQAVKELWNDPVAKDDNKDDKKKGKKSKAVKGISTIIQEIKALEGKNSSQKSVSDNENQMNENSDDSADDKGSEDASSNKKDKKHKLEVVKEIQEKIVAARVSADIALFGRMLAEQPERNTEAACQVAHPISTHKVDMEMDFFTAVDDLNPSGETGAGMMGIVGFNSACYYRYAVVDRDLLARNLARKTERTVGMWAQELTDEDFKEADKVIKAFLEAMVYAIPTGKQNSFAALNLPSFGLFVRREGGVPISLANAFSSPVRPKKEDDDIVGLSVDKLTEHWGELKKVYRDQSIKKTTCFHVNQKGRLNDLEGSVKEDVITAIEEILQD